MAKTRKGFDDALTLISLWGFLVLALNSFTQIDLSQWQTSVLMVVAGIALLLEGHILTLRQWSKNGIQKVEFPWVVSITVGIIAVIVGILKSPFVDIISPQLDSFVGLMAIISLVFIALQRWVID